MVPTHGIIQSFHDLMQTLLGIEGNIVAERDIKLEDHSGCYYLHSFMSSALSASNSSRIPSVDWSICPRLVSIMEHCHCCNGCCILSELKGLQKGFCTCEKDVASIKEMSPIQTSSGQVKVWV